MFKYIYELIPQVPKEQQNRIIILKNKLVSFACTNEEMKLLLAWREGKDKVLKEHAMTIGQKWSAVVKAFTLNELSLE